MPTCELDAVESHQKTGLNSPRPHIVIGITSEASCMVLAGRLKALRLAGFRVTLISSPGALLNQTAQEEGAEVVAIPMRRQICPLADLISFVRLLRMLLRLRPDVTEFSTPKAGLLGTVAALVAGVPVRVYMLRGLKLDRSAGLKRRVLLAAERYAAASAQLVLCNSKSLRNQALALRIAPQRKLRMLGSGSSNGVDCDRFSPGQSDVRSRLGLASTTPLLGFVGRLTKDKGVPELLEAFETLLQVDSSIRLLMVGWFDPSEDALDEEIRQRIATHPQIFCVGYVSDPAPYYRAIDILVLPTWREGFPNVVLEASATGIPVITTVSTGSRDAVVPEVTGLLIQPGYPDEIVANVLRLLRNPSLRRKMGAAGRAWVMKNYGREYVLGLATEFYKGLLAQEKEQVLSDKA